MEQKFTPNFSVIVTDPDEIGEGAIILQIKNDRIGKLDVYYNVEFFINSLLKLFEKKGLNGDEYIDVPVTTIVELVSYAYEEQNFIENIDAELAADFLSRFDCDFSMRSGCYGLDDYLILYFRSEKRLRERIVVIDCRDNTGYEGVYPLGTITSVLAEALTVWKNKINHQSL